MAASNSFSNLSVVNGGKKLGSANGSVSHNFSMGRWHHGATYRITNSTSASNHRGSYGSTYGSYRYTGTIQVPGGMMPKVYTTGGTKRSSNVSGTVTVSTDWSYVPRTSMIDRRTSAKLCQDIRLAPDKCSGTISVSSKWNINDFFSWITRYRLFLWTPLRISTVFNQLWEGDYRCHRA